jgi:hypothetical protein
MVRLGNRYLRLGAFESNHHAMPVKFRVQVRGVDSTQTTLVRIVIPPFCVASNARGMGGESSGG